MRKAYLTCCRRRDEALKAGRKITRMVVAFEAGRDGFWLDVVANDVVPHPIIHCAYVRAAGVKPKPPAAVAARGLTPPPRPKGWLGKDSGTDVITAARAGCAKRLTGGLPPRAEWGRW